MREINPKAEGRRGDILAGLHFLKPTGARNHDCQMVPAVGRENGELSVREQEQGVEVKTAGVHQGPQQSDEGLGKRLLRAFARVGDAC